MKLPPICWVRVTEKELQVFHSARSATSIEARLWNNILIKTLHNLRSGDVVEKGDRACNLCIRRGGKLNCGFGVSVLAGDGAVGGVTDSYKQVEADAGQIDVTIKKLEYINNIGAYSNTDSNLKWH